MATTTYPTKTGISQNGRMSASGIFPNFGHLVFKCPFTKKECIYFLGNCNGYRLQNSPYFCVFKYARAVKQKVCNEAENRERDWGETLGFFSPASHALWACEARALRARTRTLTPRFTDFFTDFEKKNDCFAVYILASWVHSKLISAYARCEQIVLWHFWCDQCGR